MRLPKTNASEDRSEERARTGGPTPAGQGTSGSRARLELGRHSIRVNSVQPGPVVTEMGSEEMVAAIAKAAESYGNQSLMNMLTPFLPS